jgi:hypothetical protein
MIGKFDSNKPVNPLSFGDDAKKAQSPFVFFKENTNDPDTFAIMASTDGGKYVKGGMLYYKLNDVEIFADVDCVIYVNKIENSYTVQKNNISQSVTPKNAEEQQYVILLYPVDGGEENNFTWSSVIGRQNAYEIIKSEFPSEAWDPDKSFVLVGNVKLDDALSVTEFVNYLKNSNLIPEDEFFIENYKIGDYYDGDSESD